MDIEKIRPSRETEVLVVGVRRQEAEKEKFVFLSEEVDENPLQYFDVIKVGSRVTDIKNGDRILCNFLNVTDPKEGYLNGKPCKWGLIDHANVIGVVSDE